MQAAADNMIVVGKTGNMIIAVCNGKIACLGFDECRKLNITSDTKEVTFIMKYASIQDIRKEYFDSMLKRFPNITQ